MSKKQKLVIVTGASSGIGKAISKQLFKLGYKVFNVSRGLLDIEGIEDCQCDLSDTRDLELILETFELINLEDKYELFYLINNAGIMPLEPETLDLYDKVMDVNLRAPYYLSMNLAPYLTGGIINTSSISALGPATPEDSIAYGISKAGLVTLTKYLAMKYPKLCVNSILPGFIEPTNLVEGDTPQELINTIPKKREGNVQEISELVLYLITQTYMTGQNIAFDGGLSL